MRTNQTEYLFSVNTHTPPTMTVNSGEEFKVEVRGAFDDVEDISAVPTPFTPACDGHPLAPIVGPIIVRGAKPSDVVAIDLIELTPFGSGKSAILRDFGVLRRRVPGTDGPLLARARRPRLVSRTHPATAQP
jgi:amidase